MSILPEFTLLGFFLLFIFVLVPDQRAEFGVLWLSTAPAPAQLCPGPVGLGWTGLGLSGLGLSGLGLSGLGFSGLGLSGLGLSGLGFPAHVLPSTSPAPSSGSINCNSTISRKYLKPQLTVIYNCEKREQKNPEKLKKKRKTTKEKLRRP